MALFRNAQDFSSPQKPPDTMVVIMDGRRGTGGTLYARPTGGAGCHPEMAAVSVSRKDLAGRRFLPVERLCPCPHPGRSDVQENSWLPATLGLPGHLQRAYFRAQVFR